MVVHTESPPLLAARKPVRDKKDAELTHRHTKRPRTTSLAEPLTITSVSLPLPEQSAQPVRAASPKLRRAAAVAASDSRERDVSGLSPGSEQGINVGGVGDRAGTTGT